MFMFFTAEIALVGAADNPAWKIREKYMKINIF